MAASSLAFFAATASSSASFDFTKAALRSWAAVVEAVVEVVALLLLLLLSVMAVAAVPMGSGEVATDGLLADGALADGEADGGVDDGATAAGALLARVVLVSGTDAERGTLHTLHVLAVAALLAKVHTSQAHSRGAASFSSFSCVEGIDCGFSSSL
jgi:hypothetical protein